MWSTGTALGSGATVIYGVFPSAAVARREAATYGDPTTAMTSRGRIGFGATGPLNGPDRRSFFSCLAGG